MRVLTAHIHLELLALSLSDPLLGCHGICERSSWSSHITDPLAHAGSSDIDRGILSLACQLALFPFISSASDELGSSDEANMVSGPPGTGTGCSI